MKKIQITCISMLFCIGISAQSPAPDDDKTYNYSSSIEGSIYDSQTMEVVPFANIVLYQQGKLMYGMVSDIDGNFKITSITPGKYELRISFIDYDTFTEEITLTPGKIHRLNKLLLKEIRKCICAVEIKVLPPIKNGSDEEYNSWMAEHILLQTFGR